MRRLSQLNSGASFAKVSASFSDAPNALEGGDLGWKKGSQMPALFLDVLKNMQPGEVSAPLRLQPEWFPYLKTYQQAWEQLATGYSTNSYVIFLSKLQK